MSFSTYTHIPVLAGFFLELFCVSPEENVFFAVLLLQKLLVCVCEYTCEWELVHMHVVCICIMCVCVRVDVCRCVCIYKCIINIWIIHVLHYYTHECKTLHITWTLAYTCTFVHTHAHSHGQIKDYPNNFATILELCHRMPPIINRTHKTHGLRTPISTTVSLCSLFLEATGRRQLYLSMYLDSKGT